MTRQTQRRPANRNDPRMRLNPGDEAAPGTPGTGEDICPECHGKGRIDRAPLPELRRQREDRERDRRRMSGPHARRESATAALRRHLPW